MACCSCAAIFTLIGLLLVALGVILGWVVFPIVVEKEIKKNVILEKNTDQYDRWETTPIPLEFKVYVFHVKNPKEASEGAMIEVEERGPYIYKQFRAKTNITEDSDDDTLSYLQQQFYEFDADASYPLTEDDIITFVNVPLNAVIQIAEDDPDLHDDLSNINKSMKKVFAGATSVFLDISVRDYMFGGYKICTNLKLTDIIAKVVCRKIEPLAPVELVPLDDGSYSFTFFVHKNNSDDGVYTIKSGKTDTDLLGEIIEWNHMSHTNFWDNSRGTTCDKVHGNDASIFPPLIKDKKLLTIYSTDICRTMDILYTGSMNYKGIPGARYELGPDNFMDARPELDNECYCLKKARGINRDDGCLLAGAIDLSSCHGAPIILTLPHFMDAHQKYQTSIKGLKPNKNDHVTYVELEPNTGTPLRGQKRVQFNMFLRPVEKISMTQKLVPALVPLMWVDEGMELTDDLIEVLNESYFDVMQILDGVKWAMIGVGLFMTVVSGVIWFRSRSRSKQFV